MCLNYYLLLSAVLYVGSIKACECWNTPSTSPPVSSTPLMPVLRHFARASTSMSPSTATPKPPCPLPFPTPTYFYHVRPSLPPPLQPSPSLPSLYSCVSFYSNGTTNYVGNLNWIKISLLDATTPSAPQFVFPCGVNSPGTTLTCTIQTFLCNQSPTPPVTCSTFSTSPPTP